MALLAILLPGVATGLLARSQNWSPERTQNTARYLAAGLSVAWWGAAVYGFHFASPYDWIGAQIGTPVRVFAFFAWCLSARLFPGRLREPPALLKKPLRLSVFPPGREGNKRRRLRIPLRGNSHAGYAKPKTGLSDNQHSPYQKNQKWCQTPTKKNPAAKTT